MPTGRHDYFLHHDHDDDRGRTHFYGDGCADDHGRADHPHAHDGPCINDFYDEYLDNDPVSYYDGDLAPTDQRSSDGDTCALCATFQHDASYHDTE